MLALTGSLMVGGADQTATGTSAERQVLLHHCGVQSILHDGKR